MATDAAFNSFTAGPVKNGSLTSFAVNGSEWVKTFCPNELSSTFEVNHQFSIRDSFCVWQAWWKRCPLCVYGGGSCSMTSERLLASPSSGLAGPDWPDWAVVRSDPLRPGEEAPGRIWIWRWSVKSKWNIKWWLRSRRKPNKQFSYSGPLHTRNLPDTDSPIFPPKLF